MGVLVVGGIVAAWGQLQPWQIASAQTNGVTEALLHLIPVQPRPNGFILYVQNRPDNYRGAYTLRNGLGNARSLAGGEIQFRRWTWSAMRRTPI